MNNINITELPNGIIVISEKIEHVKSFSLGFWFNVGSRDENDDNNGMSHFLEHMFFKGTKKRTAKKIAEDIESLGGYLNAFTSKEHTCFYGRGLTAHFDETFEVLADIIQNSTFSKKDISKEVNVVIDELNDIEDSPDELIFDKFESNIYDGNSLGMPIIGTEKNLRNFQRSDLFKFANENYSSDRFYIVVSGNVDYKRVLKNCSKYLNKNFVKSSNYNREIKLKSAKDLFIEKDTQQVHYILGKSTYGLKDRERVGINVLSHILGEGSSSRLFQKVREEHGIAYQINSFLNSFYDVSAFGIYLSTNENSIQKAQSIIFSEIKKMKEKKVSEVELERAKEYLIGNMLMSLESTTNRMIRMGQSIIYYKRIRTVNESIKKVKAITSREILKLSNELFENGTLTRVILSARNLLLTRVA